MPELEFIAHRAAFCLLPSLSTLLPLPKRTLQVAATWDLHSCLPLLPSITLTIRPTTICCYPPV